MDRLVEEAVKLSRSHGKKATQECPCGFYGDPYKECSCPSGLVARYQKRISGPLLDRIDMFVEVPRVDYEKLLGTDTAEPSRMARDRVEAARERQLERFRGLGLTSNADMGPMNVREMCPMDEGVRGLLQKATQQLHLSARAFHRVLKVSRTIADLAGSEAIGMAHLAEALQYRPRGLG